MDTGFRHLGQGYDIKLPLKMMKIQFSTAIEICPILAKATVSEQNSNLSRYKKILTTDFILRSLSHCAPMTTAK